jgi:hypothetical protein
LVFEKICEASPTWLFAQDVSMGRLSQGKTACQNREAKRPDGSTRSVWSLGFFLPKFAVFQGAFFVVRGDVHTGNFVPYFTNFWRPLGPSAAPVSRLRAM